MKRYLILPAALIAASLSATGAADPMAPNGMRIYNRCAACHGADGKGAPGTYPELGRDFRKLATRTEGRRYLVLVVTRGVTGPITVEGKPYRGTMPAQSGLGDEAVAAVLNHVGTAVATKGPKFRAFTGAEVAAARASGASMSGAEVARLHGSVGGG